MSELHRENPGFLLGDIIRRMRGVFNQRLEGTDLTLAQAKSLLHISRNQGVKQRELADALDIQPMTLAKQLDQLAERGLIVRNPDPNDRRVHLINLTDAAQPVLANIQTVIMQLRKDMTQDLTEAEIAEFNRALVLIRERLLTL
ncbi:MarR family transcriptional regulator [Alteromonas pelagimontana]|uniref:MarR family transcriptional regulator n=1 Tax=Alteromonas pelagimontana TaxID=1858656 RepID=A0A6M4MBF8_9ALTE|nr:MarR family transcriptional regulator [Alteromonas pelagimontana]QJR80359.1 MarR family transcriptional regulator [Alteromonas pelagimontana]